MCFLAQCEVRRSHIYSCFSFLDVIYLSNAIFLQLCHFYRGLWEHIVALRHRVMALVTALCLGSVEARGRLFDSEVSSNAFKCKMTGPGRRDSA
jgi:hypothetical protein